MGGVFSPSRACCASRIMGSERVSGFQGVSEIDVNNSSKKGIREKGDICIISRIR
jgi:hypothetical protein